MRVSVIVGSVREGRFGVGVGDWVYKHLADAGVDTDLVDLAELSFPHDADVTSFAARISVADAVIVVTPEYNHSYPGPLKMAIDCLRQEWQAKPVAFVSYGGLSGGLRAVEALRPVFAELHAVTIRETVSLHNPWEDFPTEAADEALRRLTRQLLWWASATHTALRRTPYPS
jgi:NAD(P)H-dependent FMN reductase